jgi:hypothetical protein
MPPISCDCGIEQSAVCAGGLCQARL